LKETILRRAEIRVEFSQNKNAKKNLPALPGLNFEMIKFLVPGMGADQVCRNMRVYRGNGVKTTVLSVNSDFIPERALVRFDQERGLGSGSLVRIPEAESMSGILITVSNRKPETGSQKSALTTRLGSPRGEKEKGEVRKVARDAQVEKELQEARDRKGTHPQPSVERARTSERFEDLDSSMDKPAKKKTKKVQESSSSSESSATSSDDDGEPMTKDLVRLQSLKVELEVTKLMKFKKKYRKQRKLLKKQKKSAKDTSSD
jgi:hypothetical protein